MKWFIKKKFDIKYILIYTFVAIYLLTFVKNHAFPKIQKRLENLVNDMKFKKQNLEITFRHNKEMFLKELIQEKFLSNRRQSSITEYIGIKKDDLINFIDNMLQDYRIRKIPDIKKYLKNQMEDIFFANNNDIICEQVYFQGAVNESNFLILFGESSEDKTESNWLIISVTGFTLIDRLDIVEDSTSSYLFGIFQYKNLQHKAIETNIPQSKIDLYNRFFEYVALEKAMEFFKITDTLN